MGNSCAIAALGSVRVIQVKGIPVPGSLGKKAYIKVRYNSGRRGTPSARGNLDKLKKLSDRLLEREVLEAEEVKELVGLNGIKS